ncbi:MAG: esterase family protein [Oscillospiraceae bacterium]|nr:esterase family protein [Oscillospiraceae bacterium]
MEMQYFKSYSEALGRDMECKVYGHAGLPVLFIPCQDGRFYDFENYKMTDAWAPWIESGEVMVVAIDTIDKETWSDKFGDSYWRIRRHEEWVSYIVNEVAPFISSLSKERNDWDEYPGITVFGCSLGATHAANLYFRFPETFTGMLALSGIYTAEYGFGSYMDELVYANSPVHYLENMPSDHPYIEKINRNYGIICAGQGPWEVPETSFKLRDIFFRKGINVWVDMWGHDVEHDWPWWYKQVAYFVPKLLES